MGPAIDSCNDNNDHDDDEGDAGGVDDDNDDVGCCCSPPSLRLVGPGGALEEMDRMKIIKRRLSMSLRSARPVDDSLSELAEQMALDESSTARDNGETPKQVQPSTGVPRPAPILSTAGHSNLKSFTSIACTGVVHARLWIISAV